ncbi:unnamed protein product [Camellia sinensis]
MKLGFSESHGNADYEEKCNLKQLIANPNRSLQHSSVSNDLTSLNLSFLSLHHHHLFHLSLPVTLTFLMEQELGINALHIKLRATGGNKTKTPGLGAQSALRALARLEMKIGRID